jgi:DNA-binding XRE family transcriptional regulator
MTPEVCRAARALTDMTQRELATAADISTQTVADFERGARRPHSNNVKAILQVFEGRGIKFIVDSGRIVGMDFRSLYKSDDTLGTG